MVTPPTPTKLAHNPQERGTPGYGNGTHPASACATRARRLAATAARFVAVLGVVAFAGCDVDSWMDPSRTGYFEHTPTSVPILRKIDVIEVEREPFATEVGPPRPEDLRFDSTEYEFGYGDVIEVTINDLYQEGKPEGFQRTVDQAGRILLPIVGQVQAAGLTQKQVAEEIVERLRSHIPDPSVDVTVRDPRNYRFTIYGEVGNPGVYTLSRPDFNIVEAVALAGGASIGTKVVRIVRVVDDPAMDATPGTDDGTQGAGEAPSQSGGGQGAPANPSTPAPSIDDLINQIAPPPGAPAPTPAPAPAPAPANPSSPPAGAEPAQPPVGEPAAPPPATPPVDPATPPIEPPPPPSLGAIRPQAEGDSQLAAPTTQDAPVNQPSAGVRTPPTTVPASESQYIFDVQKQEWVLVPGSEAARVEQGAGLLAPNSPAGAVTGKAAVVAKPTPVKRAQDFRLPSGQKTRIIEIDWDRVCKGDLMLRAIVRPDDMIYVEVEQGVVYIDGEIARPGVYSLPAIGNLTLSRLVSAAGGLGQIAIPQRVDLIRKITPDRETAIRVNLAAIRNRAEPDIQLRADDHIIIGTNFFATPLAVIRNGFRMTYGFGFLLDRNFGNDVFGPPPGSYPFN